MIAQVVAVQIRARVGRGLELAARVVDAGGGDGGSQEGGRHGAHHLVQSGALVHLGDAATWVAINKSSSP